MDLNGDGISDLMIGGFLVPGVYIIIGDDGSPDDKSTAIILAVVSGVLGCLFCAGREARVWVSVSHCSAGGRHMSAIRQKPCCFRF